MEIIKKTICFLLFFSQMVCLEGIEESLWDLENHCQSFVLETKKIDIPNYPDAFNPSVIRWKGALLLSFRFIPDPKFTFQSYIGLIWLDDEYNPIGSAQILELRDKASQIPSRIDDGRLIEVGGRLYFVYSDNAEPIISKKGFRVYVVELIEDEGLFLTTVPECLTSFEGESASLREKNWVPFDYNNELLLSYSINPHVTFKPLLDGSGKCLTFSKSFKPMLWSWGDLRGGTVGLKTGRGDYLSFFHSSMEMMTTHSEGQVTFHYFMGAYTYSESPPFEVLKMSPEPIIGKNFYNGKSYKPYWKPITCVFPVGFIFDENFIWVTYGRQDRECWVVKMDRNELLESLIACESPAIE